MAGPGTSTFDNDGDSQMRISGTISPDDPATPSAQTLPAHLADLSPPNSQGGVPLPANMKDSGANANGKRPISTLDGNGDVGGPAASAGLRSARVPDAQSQVKTHPASGYTWTKPEDEPGYLWKNKRAVEDAHKAHDSLVYKDYGVLDRYGDPLEMADRELAMMGSEQER